MKSAFIKYFNTFFQQKFHMTVSKRSATKFWVHLKDFGKYIQSFKSVLVVLNGSPLLFYVDIVLVVFDIQCKLAQRMMPVIVKILIIGRTHQFALTMQCR